MLAKGQQKGTKKVVIGEGACCHPAVGDLADVCERRLIKHSCHISVLCLLSNVQLDALETSYVEQVKLVVQFATDIRHNGISSSSSVDRAHDLPRGEGQVKWRLRRYALREDCRSTKQRGEHLHNNWT